MSPTEFNGRQLPALGKLSLAWPAIALPSCHCAGDLFQDFGGLVTIDDQGRTSVAIWNAEDAPTSNRVRGELSSAASGGTKVAGVFASSRRGQRSASHRLVDALRGSSLH